MVDQFLNDTADAAHLFLPCTTFLEEDDFRFSSYHNWISPIHKVVEPQGEAKSDWEIMGLLARVLDIQDEFLEKRKPRLMRALARPVLESGTSYEALGVTPYFDPESGRSPFPTGSSPRPPESSSSSQSFRIPT